jgi:TP901 family phage tail tape measure protein
MGRSAGNWQGIGVAAVVQGTVNYENDMHRLRRATEGTSNAIVGASRKMNLNIFSGMGRGIAQLGQQISSLGSSISALGFSMTFGLTVPILAGLSQSVQAGREFERSMLKLSTLTGLAEEDIQRWGEAAIRLGPKLGKMPQELIDGLYYIGSVGITDANRAMDTLLGSAKASAVGLGEVGDIAKAVSSVLVTFQDANPAEVFDALFVAVREGGAEVDSFATQLGRVLSTGKQAGADLSGMLAFISKFTQTGVTTSVATTSLLNVLSLFVDAPKEAIKVLDHFGIEYQQLQAMLRTEGLQKTLQNLYDTMGTDIAKIFTQRGTYGVFDVVNGEEFLDIINQINSEVGVLDGAFEQYTKTSDFAFQSAKSALQGVGILLYETLKKPLADVLWQLTNFLSKLQEIIAENPELVQLAVKFALITAAIGPANIILGQFIRGIGTLAIVAATPLRAFGALAGFLGGIFMTALTGVMGVSLFLGKTAFPILLRGVLATAGGVRLFAGGAAALSIRLMWLTEIVRGAISGIGALFIRINVLPRIIAATTSSLGALSAAVSVVATKFVVIFGSATRYLIDFFKGGFSLYAQLFGAIGRLLSRGVANIVGALSKVGVGFASAIVPALSSVGNFLVWIFFETIERTIIGFVVVFAGAGATIGKIAAGIIKTFTGMSTRIGVVTSSLAVSVISRVFAVVSEFGNTVVAYVGASFARIGTALSSTFAAAGVRIGLIMHSISASVATAAAGSVAALGRMATAMAGMAATWVASAAGSIVPATLGIVSSLGSMAAGFVATAASGVASILTLAAPLIAVGALVGGAVVLFAGLGRAVQSKFREVRESARKELEPMRGEMEGYGQNIMTEFGKGMIKGLVAVAKAIRALVVMIRSWLQPGSPPRALPELTEWGSGAMQAYLDGWTQFDFSAFGSISSQFQSFFNSLIPANDDGTGQAAAIANLLEFRGVLADIINEVNATGNVSVSSWQALTDAMQGATAEMQQYVMLSIQAAQAQERIKAIQNNINEVQREYAALLRPISDRLAAIQEERDDYTDARRLEELNRILADSRAPENVKRFARLEIEEIVLREQQEGLEAERDEQLDALNAQLETEQAQFEILNAQLEYFSQLVSLQTENNELIRQFGDALERAAGGAGGADNGVGELGAGSGFEPSLPLDEGLGGIPAMPEGNPFEGLTFGPGKGEAKGLLGEFDSDIRKLQEELTGLGGELAGLGGELATRLSSWWYTTVKPTWDDVMNHRLITNLSTEVQRIVDDWNRIISTMEMPNLDKLAPDEKSWFGKFWEREGKILENIIIGIQNFFGSFGGILASLTRNVGEIIDTVQGMFDGIRDAVEAAKGGWSWETGFFNREAVMAGLNSFAKGVFDVIGQILGGVIDLVARIVGAVARGIFELSFQAATAFTNWFARLFDVPEEDIQRINNKIKNGISAYLLELVGSTESWGSRIWQSLIGWFQKIYDDLVGHSIVPDTVEEIKRLFGTAWDAISTRIGELWLVVTTKFWEIYESVRDKIDLMRTKKDEWMIKIGEVWASISTFVTDATTAYRDFEKEHGDKVRDIISKIGDWMTKLINIGVAIGSFISDAKTKYEDIRFTIEQKIVAINKLKDDWMGKIDDVLKKIGDLKRDAVQWISDIANAFTTHIGNIISMFEGWLTAATNLWNYIFGRDFTVNGGDDDKSGRKSITNTNVVYVAASPALSSGNGKSSSVTFGDTHINNGMSAAEFETRVKRVVANMVRG